MIRLDVLFGDATHKLTRTQIWAQIEILFYMSQQRDRNKERRMSDERDEDERWKRNVQRDEMEMAER